MIVEQRTYVLHAWASLDEYLEAYATIGLPVQKRILEGFIGYFVTEMGTLNQLTHQWGYADLEDRRRRRALLAEDVEWQRCLKIIRPMISSMENRIMYPTDFSPIRALPVTTTDPGSVFAPRQVTT
ncbi:NIPSNAP family protein [Sinomonas flava]|uniref:NIPSNAP family protein n=1 Tax=Sinomonas flava TaxID=496857 RepID=UPI0039A4017B